MIQAARDVVRDCYPLRPSLADKEIRRKIQNRMTDDGESYETAVSKVLKEHKQKAVTRLIGDPYRKGGASANYMYQSLTVSFLRFT